MALPAQTTRRGQSPSSPTTNPTGTAPDKPTGVLRRPPAPGAPQPQQRGPLPSHNPPQRTPPPPSTETIPLRATHRSPHSNAHMADTVLPAAVLSPAQPPRGSLSRPRRSSLPRPSPPPRVLTPARPGPAPRGSLPRPGPSEPPLPAPPRTTAGRRRVRAACTAPCKPRPLNPPQPPHWLLRPLSQQPSSLLGGGERKRRRGRGLVQAAKGACPPAFQSPPLYWLPPAALPWQRGRGLPPWAGLAAAAEGTGAIIRPWWGRSARRCLTKLRRGAQLGRGPGWMPGFGLHLPREPGLPAASRASRLELCLFLGIALVRLVPSPRSSKRKWSHVGQSSARKSHPKG